MMPRHSFTRRCKVRSCASVKRSGCSDCNRAISALPVASGSACNHPNTSPQTPSNPGGSANAADCALARRGWDVFRPVATDWATWRGNVRGFLPLAFPALPETWLPPAPTGLHGWCAVATPGPGQPDIPQARLSDQRRLRHAGSGGRRVWRADCNASGWWSRTGSCQSA